MFMFSFLQIASILFSFLPIALIRKIRDKGVTIIIVEHIMKVIMTISDRIHAINFGQTIAQGTPKEVANNSAVIEAYLGEEYAHG